MPLAKESITLGLSLGKRLKDFCKKNKIMSGEKYYKVPDYNAAITFLLDEHVKQNKRQRR